MSDVIGVAKPKPAAYAEILNHANDPSSVLFIDDQERNTVAAAKFGIQTIRADASGDWTAAGDAILSRRCFST